LDPIERWLNHYDSVEQRERKRRALLRFAKFDEQEPEALLHRTPEEIEDLLNKYFRHLVDRGRLAPTSAAQWCFLNRGFFEKNRVHLNPPPSSMRVNEAEYERHYIPLQDEVKAMFDKMENLRDEALIAFLAQTGQRVGVLTVIKYSEITPVGSHGVVEVPPTYRNQLDRNVNKERVRYKFVIGKDTISLLNKLEKSSSSPWIFNLSQRQMGRIVDKAARGIGIQKEMETRLGRKMLLVHPHTFRKYWKHQVRDTIDLDLVDCMMGHKPAYRGAYDHFIDNKDLVERYMRAERNLRVAYSQETLCPKCRGKGEIQCDTCAGKGLIT